MQKQKIISRIFNSNHTWALQNQLHNRKQNSVDEFIFPIVGLYYVQCSHLFSYAGTTAIFSYINPKEHKSLLRDASLR